MSVWETSGLNNWQKPAVEEIIEDCTFPWNKLWPEIEKIRGDLIPIKSSDLSRFQLMLDFHEHHIKENGIEGHIVSIGRHQVLGVFWTDGQIEIEQSITDSQLIKEIFLAEAAHSVDYFLPLTDLQKMSIALLFHDGQVDSHTWWEIMNYGEEYYSLIGESFMALFTLAYSNITPWQDAFVHKAKLEMVPSVYKILEVDPEEELIPVPEPVPPVTGLWFVELLKKFLEWLKVLFK